MPEFSPVGAVSNRTYRVRLGVRPILVVFFLAVW